MEYNIVINLYILNYIYSVILIIARLYIIYEYNILLFTSNIETHNIVYFIDKNRIILNNNMSRVLHFII